jgi:hypothetical protein
MAMDVLLEIFANSPPSILIALGFVLILLGSASNNSGLTNAGWTFFVCGVVLQVAWLLVKARS